MKEKILTLIIGVLIGAIITTGGFFIYNKITKSDNINNEFKGMPPMMPNGEMPSRSQMLENGQKLEDELHQKTKENDSNQNKTEKNVKSKKENNKND